MKRAAKLLLLIPIVVVAVAIAVANRHRVTFSLDPFAEANPALSIDLPLFWLLFAALVLGVLLGGVATWLRQGKWRKAARRDHAELERAQRAAERNRPPTALPAPEERR
jgi:uncharacterized integral membrane protein